MAQDPQQPPTHAERARAAEPGLTRSLVGRPPVTPEAELRDLAEVSASSADPHQWDRYGEHGPVGGARAPAGRRAREAGGRGLPERRDGPAVDAARVVRRPGVATGGHPRPLAPAAHEADGPRLLHGFDFALLTDGPTVPPSSTSPRSPVPSVRPCSSCRCAMRATSCRRGTSSSPSHGPAGRGVPLHLDGARIWESAPHLGTPPRRSRPWPTASTSRSTRGSAGWPVRPWSRGRASRWPGPALAHPDGRHALQPPAVCRRRPALASSASCPGWRSTTSGRCCWRAAGGARHPDQSAPPHTTAFRIHVERDVDDVDERRVRAMEREHLRCRHRGGCRDSRVVVDGARGRPGHDGVGGRRGRRGAGAGLPD